MTKTEKVLEHLKENGSITSWEAIKLFSATRLSAIIYSLRNKGHHIISEPVSFVDKYGDKAQFAKYIYVGDRSN